MFGLAAIAVAAATALGADARGAEPGKDAEEHFLRGKALLKAGDVKGAYLEYRASWDLKQSYDIAANLGNLELDQGLPRDAAEHLAYALRTVAVSVPQDRVDTIRSLLDRARRLVGAVTVKVSVAGAEVFIDGSSVGRSPLGEEVFVDPGKRTIEARLSPYTTASTTIDIARATTVPVELVMILPATSASVAPSASSAPPLPTTVPAQHPRSMIPVGVGVAAAAAGVGVGLVGLVLSTSKSSTIGGLQTELGKLDTRGDHTVCASARPPPQCAELDSAFVSRGSFQNVAIAGFVGAGVLGLATVAYLLVPGAKPTVSGHPLAVRASVGASPSGVDLTLSGQF